MDLQIRNNRIVALYNEGMRATDIGSQMGIGTRQVQRIIRDRIGGRPMRGGKSKEYALDNLRTYVVQLLQAQGRNFTICEQCMCPIPRGRFQLHHTKYDGAQLSDLQIVCQACNLAHYNRFLD